MNISKILSLIPPFFRRHKLIQFFLLISPQSRIQLIQFNGSARLWADLSDPNPRNYLLQETFEPEFFEIAKPFLSEGGVFFDIGANFGFCSFGLMSCLPKQKLEYHLFEANPNIYQILLKSAKLHPDQNFKINNRCVTDQEGISKLKIIKHQLGMSFISDEGDLEVTNLTLDQYIREFSIQSIYFMKIDIEGWEFFALQGGKNSFQNGIIKALYIEISSVNLGRNGFYPEDCCEFLRNVGFQLFYCKRADLESRWIDDSKSFILTLNGYPLRICPLVNFPKNYQTDILAIHNQSSYLNDYQ